MGRRLAVLVVLVALALVGSGTFALSSQGRAGCSMGGSCPLRAAEGGRCPARTAWSVELGCCTGAPAVPPAPAPTVGCPFAGGADAAPAVLSSGATCPRPLDRPGQARERARAERLHDLGLFTLISVLLI